MQEARQIKADDDEQTKKEMQEVQAALRILRMRENLNTHDGQNGVPNLVSSCQQTSEQMARFNSIWDSWKNKGSYDELVKMFSDPPTLLPPKLKKLMEPLAESFKITAVDLPQWMKHICRNRDLFLNCALFSSDDPGDCDKVYVPRVCMQKPLSITWQQLDRKFISRVPPWRSDGFRHYFLPLPPRFFDLHFVVQPIFYDSASVPISPELPIWVLRFLTFTEDMEVACPDRPFAWEHFIQHHPVVRPTTESEPRERKARVSKHISDLIEEQLRMEFPWLKDDDFKAFAKKAVDKTSSVTAGSTSEYRGTAGASSSTGDGGSVAPNDDPPSALDVDVGDVVAEIAEIRSMHAHDDEEDVTFFYVWHRGGEDTKKKTGHGTDIATCFARSCALSFCSRYKWPKQKGFTYTAVYDHDTADALAKQWCRRANHYCSIWHAHSCDPDYRFQPDDDPMDWLVWLDFLTIYQDDDYMWEHYCKPAWHCKPTNPD